MVPARATTTDSGGSGPSIEAWQSAYRSSGCHSIREPTVYRCTVSGTSEEILQPSLAASRCRSPSCRETPRPGAHSAKPPSCPHARRAARACWLSSAWSRRSSRPARRPTAGNRLWLISSQAQARPGVTCSATRSRLRAPSLSSSFCNRLRTLLRAARDGPRLRAPGGPATRPSTRAPEARVEGDSVEGTTSSKSRSNDRWDVLRACTVVEFPEFTVLRESAATSGVQETGVQNGP